MHRFCKLQNNSFLNYNDNLITHFFEAASLSTIESAVNSGNVVVVRKNGHYLLLFGLQYDGDIVYADPHEGGFFVVNESYFSGCDAFELGGINQSQMRILAQ